MDDALRAALEGELGTTIRATAPVHGGDVAVAYRLDLGDGHRVFAKTHRNPPAGFFTTEAAGLRWLAEPAVVRVPTVIAVADDPAFLVLEWIDTGQGAAHERTEAELGRALAALHRAGSPSFGREDRRTTGSRGLPNEPCPTWAEFYATQRLLPLARLARDGGALGVTAVAGLAVIAERLVELGGPAEPAARLHGDLWAGNRLVDDRGTSWLIDPAAHGGHREFDLAMMRLFGGFGADCFAAYQESFPLAEGWEARVELHQLAPLVVHAIKFGGAYVGASERAIRRYR
jgi:fructosamine-3-kinase